MSEAPGTCRTEIIERFLDHQLTDEETNQLEQHLDHCDACCDQLRKRTADAEQWMQVEQHLSDAFDPEEMASPTEPLGIPLDFLAPTDDPHMLGRFAGYEIAGVIGMGGMGIVLKGFDRALNRYVAIKALLPQFASSAAARKRFAREGRAAAAVVHDNVIEIYGVSVGETQAALPYLVMPYVRGESLSKRLQTVGVMNVEEMLRVGIQLASGLAAAHAQG
ncbi:MAG: protein kinase, partial [Planctomycetota bacterium]